MRIEAAQAEQIVSMICEGLGIRSISRLTGVCQETVLRVLATAGEHCARLLDAKVRSVDAKQVECDEIYSFVRTRQDNTPHEDKEHGAFFCYLALDRDSKLIISHLIAKRHRENTTKFIGDLKQRVVSRFQLSTDGYLGYTGQRGAIFQTFKHEIDYGTEIKEFGALVTRAHCTMKQPVPRRFNPIVCKWVKRRAHIGNPDLSQINTSRAERLNLSVRLFNRRFTRLTLGYSKTLENHKAAAALFTAFYNFCRVHGTTKQTPAHAAGLTDHTWTVKELLGVAFLG